MHSRDGADNQSCRQESLISSRLVLKVLDRWRSVRLWVSLKRAITVIQAVLIKQSLVLELHCTGGRGRRSKVTYYTRLVGIK